MTYTKSTCHSRVKPERVGIRNVPKCNKSWRSQPQLSHPYVSRNADSHRCRPAKSPRKPNRTGQVSPIHVHCGAVAPQPRTLYESRILAQKLRIRAAENPFALAMEIRVISTRPRHLELQLDCTPQSHAHPQGFRDRKTQSRNGPYRSENPKTLLAPIQGLVVSIRSSVEERCV